MSKTEKGFIISYLLDNTSVDIEDIENTDNIYELLTDDDWEEIENWK